MSSKHFNTRSTFESAGKRFHFYDLRKIPTHYDIDRLPYAFKILLENLLRHEDGITKRPLNMKLLLVLHALFCRILLAYLRW
jgi:aconitase A